jgi:hypothetical protein
MTIQAALDSNWTHRAVGGRLAPQHLIITLPIHLNPWHIEVKTRQLSASCLTLGRHEEPVSFLLDLLKVFRRLRRLPATAQELVKLIHRGRIAGQKALALQCWHRMLL